MAQESYISAQFPDELQAIRRLRSENPVFNEICDDLDLLGRDIALFSGEQRLSEQGAYLDILESIQALHHELVEFLQRTVKPIADEM